MKQAKQRRRKKGTSVARTPFPSRCTLANSRKALTFARKDRAPVFALHAAINDATSIVVGAIFRPTECREGYSLVMRQGIKKYGIPLGLYSDRHTIFRSPNETKPLSDFGEVIKELCITHLKELTSQAKGRIERL